MFDIGGLELIVLAALALIIVGPKELPGMIRNVGRWVAKARGLAREFQQGMEEAAREADLDKEVNALKSAANPRGTMMDELSKIGDETKAMVEDGLDGKGSRSDVTQRPPSPSTPPSAATAPTSAPTSAATAAPVQRIEPDATATPDPVRSEPAQHPGDNDMLEEAQSGATAPKNEDFLDKFQRDVGFKSS
ncbi:MAG: Sec-independent protein translocase protein TatB [Pseudomonadota bacterium]